MKKQHIRKARLSDERKKNTEKIKTTTKRDGIICFHSGGINDFVAIVTVDVVVIIVICDHRQNIRRTTGPKTTACNRINIQLNTYHIHRRIIAVSNRLNKTPGSAFFCFAPFFGFDIKTRSAVYPAKLNSCRFIRPSVRSFVFVHNYLLGTLEERSLLKGFNVPQTTGYMKLVEYTSGWERTLKELKMFQ